MFPFNLSEIRSNTAGNGPPKNPVLLQKTIKNMKNKPKSNWMAIDQYGATFHNLGEFPRKELLIKLNRKSASKMYCENQNGETVQTGYVIAGLWLSLYRVFPMHRKAGACSRWEGQINAN